MQFLLELRQKRQQAVVKPLPQITKYTTPVTELKDLSNSSVSSDGSKNPSERKHLRAKRLQKERLRQKQQRELQSFYEKQKDRPKLTKQQAQEKIKYYQLETEKRAQQRLRFNVNSQPATEAKPVESESETTSVNSD